jgi:signal peptidase I
MRLHRHLEDEGSGRRRSVVGRIASALLWWVTPCVVVGLVALYFGAAIHRGVYPPVVPVQGTSMHPLLHAGDLVLLKHADIKRLKKGDIIAFRTSDYARKQYGVPPRYVHRIIAITTNTNGTEKFQTKGDNVAGKDPFWTDQGDVVGLYAGHIKKVGYIVLFIHSKQAKILGAALLLVAGLYLGMGFFERRAEDRERTVIEFATMVEEVRELAGSMAGPASTGTGQDGDVRETLRELVGAVSEYGKHLRSHTSVMQNLAATTAELHAATEAMRAAVDGTQAFAPLPDTFETEVALALERGRRTIDVLERALRALRLQVAS